MYRSQVLICGGTGCTSSSSEKIINAMQVAIDNAGLNEEVKVVKTGCFGLCALGPIVIVYPEGCFYSRVTPEDAEEIVNEHLLKGRIVKRLLYDETIDNANDTIKSLNETPFYKSQHRIALRNCGVINPENIDEYIANDGYAALGKALTEMTPAEVIQTVLDSGLRGRGGAGFPTGLKWKFAAGNDADQKYVCCNADEGDPGAFMDRSILEGDPHALIEAMAIAGYAIGANQGYIYVRAEYPIAVSRLKIALKQAREYGLLGKNIFDTGFDFDLDVRLGAGAFVCGEETALIASLEGERGMPRLKPPFPAAKGFWQKPTDINNVETLANVPWIIYNGGAAFSKFGTEKSPGTKVFALAGKIKKGGLVEVPMGMTINEIIYGIGGGIRNDKQFKAVQMGGPSGGCIPASLGETQVTYEDITKTGAIVGSGGMIVMDEDTCMVDMARYFLNFTRDESCGKCNYCRIGTKRLLEILTRITEGEGRDGDIELLQELATKVMQGSLCGLGQTAPNPVLSTIRHFRNEYEDHIYNKKCTAHSCKALIKFSINDKCKGCTLCARNCPVNAITGKVKEMHVIDQDVCIKCGKCLDNCKFGAIDKI